MASFHAELHLAGTTYRVVRCQYACHQPTDARGRVSAKVRHDLLHLALDVPDDDALLAWAAAPFKPLAGEVVFYDATQRVAHETIAFAAGQCVGYHETFESGASGDGAYVCQLTVAAPAFELRSGGPTAAVSHTMAVVSTAINGEAGKANAAKKLSKKLALGGGEIMGAAAEEAAGVATAAAAALAPLTIAKAVNPLKGTKNCSHITEAIIARLHGTDPDAVAPNEGTRTIEQIEALYDTKFEPATDFHKIFDQINNSPEGTIGLIVMGPKVVTDESMGHIVTIVNHNGKATIIEAQHWGPYDPVETITSSTRAARRYGDDNTTDLGFTLIPPPSSTPS